MYLYLTVLKIVTSYSMLTIQKEKVLFQTLDTKDMELDLTQNLEQEYLLLDNT